MTTKPSAQSRQPLSVTALQTPLRIGTFNVRWDAPEDGEHRWERRRERLFGLLRSWEPDVLGLQEPLLHQLEQICQALPDYAAVGVGRADGVSAGEFCPILYRQSRFKPTDSGTFWLSPQPDVPGSLGWGARHPRICTWAHLAEQASGASFFLYNVHLDHEAQEAREKGVDLLLARIRQRSAPDPVVVTGDFNAGLGNPAVARIQAAASPVSQNALAAAQTDQSRVGTFHGFTGKAGKEPIDYIFLSPEWQPLDGQVVHGDGRPLFPSDHFPVAVTVQLGPA